MIINTLNEQFVLLKEKPIYEILDGDISFGEYQNETGRIIKIQMPYLSGPDLCEICRKFGIPMEYRWGGTNLSRWQYVEKLFDESINKNNCSALLMYFFGKNQFKKHLAGLESEEVDKLYKQITQKALSAINGILGFGGYELCRFGTGFVMNKVDEQVKLDVPEIRSTDRHYIMDVAARASNNIDEGNLDTAITQSRTLLEEVFCYMIEHENEEPSQSGDINRLYSQVKSLYRIHQDEQTDKRMNDLINGFNKIIASIGEMRNKGSDSHGLGQRRVMIKDYHARLYVNAAVSLSEFMISLMNDNSGLRANVWM